jgi:hypothetical protein
MIKSYYINVVFDYSLNMPIVNCVFDCMGSKLFLNLENSNIPTIYNGIALLPKFSIYLYFIVTGHLITF